ncbi:MAG TPA: serine/threonine-protein kinase [Blastocatellia bacterium]|nr:serine/threonine-protein kinase [Blastocatellia bacterium]
MSGFELQKAAGTNDPNLASALAPVSKTPTNGGSVCDTTECDTTEVLSSRFDCLSLVSDRGGIAVYHGRDRRDDRPVALKVLHAHGDDLRRLELFRLEASAAARLSHRNIVRSSGPQEINGTHFSILERRPDVETLKMLLDRRGWLDLGLALGIVLQIADALDYAHSLGVLHLSVHPENVLIGTDGAALLSDFGVEARGDLAWAHKERASACPLHYISPEQARGEALDARSDLYSLGVVFYQMLTDRLPVDSEDPDTVRQRHVTHSPRAPHLYCSDIPFSLSAIITRMLEKDPNKRFQDVTSFREALDRSTSQPPTMAGWSDGCESQPLDIGYEDDQSPIELESLLDGASREPWEPPSIRVIESPVDQVHTLDLGTETVDEEREPDPPSNERLETPRDVLLSHELSSTFALRSQWRPVMLVLAMAIAALIGILILARADRSRFPNRTVSEPTAEGSDAGIDRTAALPSSKGTGEKPVVTSPPPAGDHQPPAETHQEAKPANAQGATTQARAAVRPQPVARPSSTSQRLRQGKAKWRRPTRYLRRYGDTDSRYFRLGER